MKNILKFGDKVQLVDLQLMRFASVAADLSYFLYVNLKPAILAKNMDAFLSCYLECLVAHVRDQNVDLENTLTMAWLKEEMRRYALFGTVNALWVMPVFYRKDLDAISSAPQKDMSEEQERRIKDVVLYYAQRHGELEEL